MAYKTVHEVLEEVFREEEKQERNEDYVISFNLQYEEDNVTIYDFQVKSKSREGITHKVRIVTQDDYYLVRSCTCEGFTHHHKCWHLDYVVSWLKEHNLW